MIQIKTFPFNPFAVNTYVLYDESGEGIIIDAGNYSEAEREELLNFVHKNSIEIKALYLTHAHIDHITGAAFLSEHFALPFRCHKAGEFLFSTALSYALSLGLQVKKVPHELEFIENEASIEFGNSKGIALYTPGHVDGSLCYYFEKEKLVFTGDVLFRTGIGRTDLPTGDYGLLEKSIRDVLYKLPDEVKVYPGHGPQTSIGFEKRNNPFFQSLY